MRDSVEPRVASSIDELIAGATDRVEIHPDDGKSGAAFETLSIDGEPHFLKVLSYEGDWIMRCSGNLDHWEYKAWCAGLYHRVPPEIDHAMVAMALDHTGPKPRLAMLMHDISDGLIPPGDDLISVEQHDRFMDHMAAFHAAYWGWTDDVGLSTVEQRALFFSPENVEREMSGDAPSGVIKVASEGWGLLLERAPQLAGVVARVHAEPSVLAHAVARTPATFVMGDWKMGNLGAHSDGRSIVLDWAYVGSAPGGWDLMWYLALNRARVPRSRDESIATYRAGLETRGIDTTGWFDRQLGLCVIGVFTMIGWEKALGEADELGWWDDAVARALPFYEER
jgi:hypothetical protein